MVALAVFAALVSACGGQAEVTSEMRAVRGIPLYWLGEEFERERLAHISGPNGPRGGFGVIYGTCEPGPGTEGGCSPMPQVQTVRMCFLDVAATPDGLATLDRWKTFRVGPNTAINRGGALVLLGSNFEVRIFADDAQAARRAAAALRVVNDPRGPNTKAGPLPVPPPNSDARWPCEGNPNGVAVLPPGRRAP